MVLIAKAEVYTVDGGMGVEECGGESGYLSTGSSSFKTKRTCNIQAAYNMIAMASTVRIICLETNKRSEPNSIKMSGFKRRNELGDHTSFILLPPKPLLENMINLDELSPLKA